MENNKKVDIKEINKKIEKESAFIDLHTLEINKVIVGQKHMIERLLIGLLGKGHILLEGVPGLAKTLAINSLTNSPPNDISGWFPLTPRSSFPTFLFKSPVIKQNSPNNLILSSSFLNLVQLLRIFPLPDLPSCSPYILTMFDAGLHLSILVIL